MSDGDVDVVSGLALGTASSVGYLISNTGSAMLTLGTPSLGGMVNCSATVSTVPSALVPAAEAIAMVVMVTPVSAGAWRCGVPLATNDADENPIRWTLGATATEPPIGTETTTGNGTASSGMGCGLGGGLGILLVGIHALCGLIRMGIARGRGSRW